MKFIKSLIPNIITSFNLLSGCLAVMFTLNNQLNAAEYAPYLIILAGFFDLIDGALARLLKSQSEFGKQLDSLADLVSFGIAPAMIMFEIFKWSVTDLPPESFWNLESNTIIKTYVPFVSLLLVIAAALRLARFNIETGKHEYFKGLPTPASAFVIVGLRLLMIEPADDVFFHNVLLNINYNIILVILLTYLMLSNLRMLSLKFSSFSIKENTFRYILIFISLILLILFKTEGIILVMAIYIVLSIIHMITCKSS